MEILFKRGTTAENNSYRGASGSISIDLALMQLRLHDGNTIGGFVVGENATTLGGHDKAFYTNATNLISGTLPAGRLSGTYAIEVAGNATTATSLAVARTINGTSFDGSVNITTANWGTSRTLSFTGDVTGSASVNGASNVAFALTLANSGVSAGTYNSVTVDAKGRVTAGNEVVTGLVTSSSSTGVSNVATENTNTFLNITEKVGAATASVGTSTQITGAGTVSVSSDTSGKITITGQSAPVVSVAGKTGAVTLVNVDVGLGNVDNTSDANKPISTATAAALNGKVDKVSGKQLSTEDYTTAEKNKLADVEAGAQVNIATNIGQGSRTSSTIPLTSSTGTGTALPSATTSLAGLQSAADKAKLDGIAAGATANATNAQLRDRATHTGVQPIASVDGLQDALDEKVDNTDPRLTNAREWTASAVTQAEAEAGTSTTARKWTAQRVRQAILGWWNTSTFKTKLDGIEDGATKNATDAQLRSRATHTGMQPISSVTNLQSSLDSKVDKQSGYGLSQENYTPAEKSKLASIEGSKFKGEYVSLAALNAAHPSPEVGSYAYVDQGAGQDVVKYIWDSSDTKWVLQQGESAALTPSDVKNLYESNADTNAFTNSEKSKLAGIESGAQVNVGTNLAMGGSGNSRTITSSTGNNVSVPVATTSAAGFISTTDKSKLDGLNNVNLIAGSNVSLSGAYPNITISSTNTTYSEISESEVTAGTASTARAISARRLKFAIDTHGLQIGTTSTTAKAGNWTPTWGNVSGKPTTFTPSVHTHTLSEITDAGSVASISTNGSTANYLRGDGTWVTPPNTNTTYSEITTAEIDAGTASTLRTISGRRMKYALDKKSDTGHGHAISDVTGLQAAIDSKANTSTQVIAGTGLTGGGTLAANRTLSVNYGTSAGTAAQGNDSRLSNSREWTASVVSQAEAEAGTATTARKWTAQRVRQSFDATWATAKTEFLGTMNTWTQPQIIHQGVANSALGLFMPTSHNVAIEFATATESEEPIQTYLGVRANGTLATGSTPHLLYDIHTSATLPVRSAFNVNNYTGNGVTRAEDERAALELGPPTSSANANLLPGQNRNIQVSGNRTVAGLATHHGKGVFSSMTIRSSNATARTITLGGTIINKADYNETYVVTNTEALYLEGRFIEQGFVITFLTKIPILP